ncbi:MAG: TonB-dependent receptor plug domain-containing protein [Ignavibacteriaceae bacterium]
MKLSYPFYSKRVCNIRNRYRIGIAKVVAVVIFSCHFLMSQNLPQYNLNDVIVTASRVPLTFSDLTRDVVVIDKEEIKKLPVSSVQELLQYVLGLGLEQRGIDGVQSDVTIRGGNSEETLIMIDGVSINDPQTGHHNLNLPVPLQDVQKIEILEGPGSSIYGANAFSGVINIITKKGNDKSLSLGAEGGENGYYKGSIYMAYPFGIINNHFAVSKKKSDGYIHNTDFDITNFSYGVSLNTKAGMMNLFFGYDDKKYGANSFYSVLFPNQWEHTTTKLLSLTGDIGTSNFILSPKIYWRRNDDSYLLDYTNPPFYHNIHQTNIYGAELQASIISGIGTTSFGGDYNSDNIKSNNLGDHSRERKGFFAEQTFSSIQDLTIIANGFAYDYPTIGWKFWPDLDLGYNVTKNFRVFGTIGRAFRIPSYTELYYTSPTSMGNPNLVYEETTDYEVGMNFNHPLYSAKISLFRKEGKNLIDWVRENNNQPWTATNIATLNTNGIELSFMLQTDKLIHDFPVNQINISYSYLNSGKNTMQFQSQYLLDYLRHQLIISVDNTWWYGIRQNWEVRYDDRVNFEDYFLVDTQISKEFDQFEVFVKATNLFNKPYSEISGIPLPGRWVTAGVQENFSL